ncbi:hypothetical protein R0K05_19495, partial [Planococcus sp. SIMBA_160]
VMRRRVHHKAKTTAVSLLLDGSRSMQAGSGMKSIGRVGIRRIDYSACVAAAVGQAMELGGIDSEITAFTGGRFIAKGFFGPEIVMPKRFGERMAR